MSRQADGVSSRADIVSEKIQFVLIIISEYVGYYELGFVLIRVEIATPMPL